MMLVGCGGDSIQVQIGGHGASAVRFSEWKYDGAFCVAKMTYAGTADISRIDAVLYDKEGIKTLETTVSYPSASKGETVRAHIGSCAAAKIVLTVN